MIDSLSLNTSLKLGGRLIAHEARYPSWTFIVYDR